MNTYALSYRAAGFLALLATLFSPLLSLAQGSLAPNGSPAPTMKTLDQVEARTPISSSPFVITNPGAYYLTTNLTGVGSQYGITIATNDVVLDLNGFVMTGTPSFSVGIYVNEALTNITVRNGTVRGWSATAVLSEWDSSHGIVFERLTVRDSSAGISLRGTGVVRDCVVLNNSSGGIFGFNRATISDCTVKGSSSGPGIQAGNHCVVKNCFIEACDTSGIYLLSAADNGANDIFGNTCISNNLGGSGGHAGIYVNNGLNRIEGNRVVGNGVAGIAVNGYVGNSNNIVIKNISSGHGAGNYVVPSSHIIGPLIDTAGTITNVNPWANFSN